jgi:hypothetical protein
MTSFRTEGTLDWKADFREEKPRVNVRVSIFINYGWFVLS